MGQDVSACARLVLLGARMVRMGHMAIVDHTVLPATWQW